MSFVDEEDIFKLSEGLMKKIFKEAKGVDLKTPFPRLKYSDAIARFGTDKPDTRFGLELVDITCDVKNSRFKIFEDCVKKNGRIVALSAPVLPFFFTQSSNLLNLGFFTSQGIFTS